MTVVLSNYGLSKTCIESKKKVESRISQQLDWFQKKHKSHIPFSKAVSSWEYILKMDEKLLISKVCNTIVPKMATGSAKDLFSGKTCKSILSKLWPALFLQMNYETGWFLSDLVKYNNFGGLHLTSFKLRPLHNFLKLDYGEVFWLDNGNERRMLTFKSIEDGVLALMSFYIMPRKFEKEEGEGDFLYATCLKDFATNDSEDTAQVLESYLNCAGKIWAEAGTMGNYGTKAFGVDRANYTMLKEYISSCRK